MQLLLTWFSPAPLVGRANLVALAPWILVCAALVVVTAFADYITGYEHSLSILYLLPILLATWKMGLGAGLCACVLALVAWLASDTAMGHVYSHRFYHFWEGIIRLCTWVVFSLLLDRLRVALAMADERFVTVLAGLDAAVYVTDPQTGEVLYTNERCNDAFGSTPPNTRAIRHRQYSGRPSASPSEESSQTEFHDAVADRWYFVARREIRWIDGRNVDLLIATDVTDRRRAETLAQKQQERLEMTSRLTTLGELATTLAHEINQPLAAITNYCKGSVRRLRTGAWKTEELLDALQKTALQAERAGSIVQRARAYLLKRPALSGPCDVNAAVMAVVRLVELEAERHDARMELELSPELPLARADSIMIELVLMNLIKNGLESMHYTPAPRRNLTIRTGLVDDRFVRVDVADQGCGLPPQMRRDLFMPFFTTKAEGMGMGLHICRSTVERHGGRIWASSNAEGGTILHFTLPLLQP